MQHRIGRIVAGTDFSEDATAAVQRAAQLARLVNADSLLIVHALEASLLEMLQSVMQGDESLEVMKEETQRRLVTLGESLTDVGSVTVSTDVVTGRRITALVRAAERGELLVLGAHGGDRTSSRALGTTALRVTHKSDVPVLMVRRPPAGPYKNVLVATDFSDAAVSAAQFASKLPDVARFTVAHAYQFPYEMNLTQAGVGYELVADYREKLRVEAESEMAQFISNTGLPPEQTSTRLEVGYPPAVLRTLIKQCETDLLVLGKQGQSVIGDRLLGGVTHHMLADADCDVLVV